MRHNAYLERSRHGIYYFRIRTPKSIHKALSLITIRRSLRTRCRREAAKKAGLLLSQIEQLFDSILMGKRVDLSALGLNAHKAAVSNDLEQSEGQPKESSQHSQNPVKTGLQPSTYSPKLSTALTEYLKTLRLNGVSEKTIGDKRSVVELLIKVVGDCRINEVDRNAAKRFRDVALQLPPRMNKLGVKTLEQAIEKAQELDQTITPTTYNNYIKYLTAFYSWAKLEGYCEGNPFEGLRVSTKNKVSEQRSRFYGEDLEAIFNPTIYPSRYNEKPYQYWLPLLGLYTGARMGELCQLYLDDIVQADGIDCLHIREGQPDQRLKKATTERLIPISSRLKDMGFMVYVAQRRALGDSRLFPELSRHKRHGYSAIPSKWFARFREVLGFKGGESKKDFHSFRHTVADHLKQQGLPESLVGSLLGHTTGGITFSRYGKDFRPKTLVDVVERLDFEVHLKGLRQRDEKTGH